MITDIQHKDGKFFINGDPIKTSTVQKIIEKLIEENAMLRKRINKIIHEEDEGIEE